MKKAAKDKKEKEVKEAEKPKYAKSQDKEHDDAKELGAKLAQAKKKKVDEMDLEKEKEDAEVMDDTPALQESKQEEKQVVTETPQQTTPEQPKNDDWYWGNLYNKLKSKWAK